MQYLCKKYKAMTTIRNTLLTALVMLITASAVAQEKLAVFSDPHLLSSALVSNPGQSYFDDLAANNKMIDLGPQVMQALVDTLLAIHPTAVLVPGDLTKEGESRSHADMNGFLGQLREAGIKVFIIPGNHDVNNSNAVGYYGDYVRPENTLNSLRFAVRYADMGYNQALERDANSLSYLAEPIDGVWLIAVDDSRCKERDSDRSIDANGIPDVTLQWILAKADQGQALGKQVIMMMHHQLVEHFDDQDNLVGDATVVDAPNLQQQFIEHGIKMVLTGHMHFGNITTQFNDARTDSLVEITTGSTLTYPCQFRTIDVAPDRGTFSVNTCVLEHIEGIPDFQEYALNRFKNSTRPIVASLVYHSWDDLMAAINQYSDYFGEVNFTQEQATDAIYNAFHDDIERVMVAMAQGNEPTRDIQGLPGSIYNKVGTLVDELLPNLNFFARLIVVPMIRNQLESMIGKALDSILSDCNGYGTSLAHVTNDLTPTLRFAPIAQALLGDINLDGIVDVSDVNIIINIMLGKAQASNYTGISDLNGDGSVDVSDVNAVINIMLGK